MPYTVTYRDRDNDGHTIENAHHTTITRDGVIVKYNDAKGNLNIKYLSSLDYDAIHIKSEELIKEYKNG